MRFGLCILCLFIGMSMFGNNCLKKLQEGNHRFVKGDYPRKELIAAQYPFCAVLACADSRVAPELIFDQNLGDLFVVRIAGNVATKGIIESLDFASKILKIDLIVVMGHQNCGAVDAVIHHRADVELGSLYSYIQPSVQGIASLKDAVIANVKSQIARIKEDPLLQKRFNEGSLNIVGAYYNFETGLVDFFPP
jgi:carbonic anhydrase